MYMYTCQTVNNFFMSFFFYLIDIRYYLHTFLNKIILKSHFSFPAENVVHVNGGSPSTHAMQPHIVLSPTQTFSPVKTRRMRHGLSNSEPQLKTNQNVPNVDQGWLF